jgi:hypothetical protein
LGRKLYGIVLSITSLLSCAVEKSKSPGNQSQKYEQNTSQIDGASNDAKSPSLALDPGSALPILPPTIWYGIPDDLPTSPWPRPTNQMSYSDWLRAPERRQSSNVIDARAQPCENPNLCPSRWSDKTCEAVKPLTTKYPDNSPKQCDFIARYQTGLCLSDSEGVVTSTCEVAERVCVNSSQSKWDCLNEREP